MWCSNILYFVATASFIFGVAEGHGNMVKPYTWMDTGGKVGMKEYMSCDAGADLQVGLPGYFQGSACFWFTDCTFIPGEKTLDYSMSTWPQFFDIGAFDKNPWMAPGSAPILSPCGIGGGNPNGCPGGSSLEYGEHCIPSDGWGYGPRAEDYYISPGFPDVVTTEWKIGSVVEAAWGMVANHGGGYSYRLCKVPEYGMEALTEECFQQTPLEFSGEIQWVQYGEDTRSRIQFEANRTKEGTFPEGSQWTKNPIPSCLFNLEDPGPNGDYGVFDINCTGGTQFPPRGPGLYGCGASAPPFSRSTFAFSIVDQLLVPTDITPGEYVLSFRWDCEQGSQVFTQCANIKIIE